MKKDSIIGIRGGDKMAKQDKMIAATRAKSARKVEQLKAAVDEMVEKGIAVTPYSVEKRQDFLRLSYITIKRLRNILKNIALLKDIMNENM